MPKIKIIQKASINIDPSLIDFDGDRISVKLSNLPPNTSQEALRELMALKKIEIKGINVSTFRYNKTKDYCFVKFHSRMAAEKCIQILDDLVYNNFSLKAEIAKPPTKKY